MVSSNYVHLLVRTGSTKRLIFINYNSVQSVEVSLSAVIECIHLKTVRFNAQLKGLSRLYSIIQFLRSCLFIFDNKLAPKYAVAFMKQNKGF